MNAHSFPKTVEGLVPVTRYMKNGVEKLLFARYPASAQSIKITYNAKEHRLESDTQKVQLGNGDVEDCFCKLMFKQKAGERVSWDIIAQHVYGQECKSLTKEERTRRKHCVDDARRRLNEKIFEEFLVKEYFDSEKSEYSRKNR